MQLINNYEHLCNLSPQAPQLCLLAPSVPHNDEMQSLFHKNLSPTKIMRISPLSLNQHLTFQQRIALK